MMSAAASGRTACASTSAGKTRPVSGGVKKLRGDCVHPDTARAQLKIEDPDDVAEDRLAAAVRREQGRRGTAKLARTDHHRHALARAAQRSHDDLPAFDL
jgi:hypothetical protein